MQLSVVIPTLSRLSTVRLLSERLRELFPTIALEIIVVTPSPPGDVESDQIKVVRDRGSGVYAAYMAGLARAAGRYVWFLGDDDYPLDGAASLTEIMGLDEADAIVCPVIFSSGRYYAPCRSKFVLIFRNWSQQGILYKRATLLRYRFYQRFRVQADHYVNILLRSSSTTKVIYGSEPICVFGVHGLTSMVKDERFRAVRPALVRRAMGVWAYAAFCTLVQARGLLRRVTSGGRG